MKHIVPLLAHLHNSFRCINTELLCCSNAEQDLQFVVNNITKYSPSAVMHYICFEVTGKKTNKELWVFCGVT